MCGSRRARRRRRAARRVARRASRRVRAVRRATPRPTGSTSRSAVASMRSPRKERALRFGAPEVLALVELGDAVLPGVMDGPIEALAVGDEVELVPQRLDD